MSRRELIVMTLILNIALLSLLFFLAERVEEPPLERKDLGAKEVFSAAGQKSEEKAPSRPVTSVLSSTSEGIPEIAIDEVDSVLRDFAFAMASAQSSQHGASSPQVKIDAGNASKERHVIHVNESTVSKNSSSRPLIESSLSGKGGSDGGSVVGEVVVKRGDVLEKIARAHGTSVEALRKVNGLTNDVLRVGQLLRLPAPGQVVSEKKNVVSEKKSPEIKHVEVNHSGSRKEGIVRENGAIAFGEEGDMQLYKVRSGDNPWKIAKQFHMDLEELLRVNQLDEELARNLKPGYVLRVRR